MRSGVGSSPKPLDIIKMVQKNAAPLSLYAIHPCLVLPVTAAMGFGLSPLVAEEAVPFIRSH